MRYEPSPDHNTSFKGRQRSFIIALLVGVGGILYGYDISVISGALLFIRNSVPITDTQIGNIVAAVLAGGLVGTLITGPIADRYGRRLVIALASIIFIIGIVIILSANSFAKLLTARLLLGVGVGIIAVAVPLYVTELVSARDRGKCVTFFQLLLTLGIVLAYFVDLSFTASGNWRAMFAAILIPATILLALIYTLPESPRWLVSKNDIKNAQRILGYLRSPAEAATEMTDIQQSLAQRNMGGWLEFLRGPALFPLLIAGSVAALNQLTGINMFLQYAPDILKNTGIGSNTVSMLGTLGIGLLNFICTTIAVLLIDKMGRKPLLIFGIGTIIIAEIFLGIVNYVGFLPIIQGYLSIIGLFGFIIGFAIGPGVVVWLVMSELFPTQIRGKGLAICLFLNSLASTLLSNFFPELRHVIGMAGTYWLCAGFTIFYFLIAKYWLPETKQRSLENIQAELLKQDTK